MTILYNVLNDNLTKEDLLETSSKPSWLKEMPLLAGGFSNLKEWFKTAQPNDPVPKTVKACPGIKDLLSKVIILKFPTDLLLDIQADGTYKWRTPWPVQNFNVSSHQSWQYNFSDNINIKISLPLSLSCTKNVDIIYLEPFYHTSVPYKVIPGIVKLSSKHQSIQPINLFFDRENKTYQFRAGQPLCYIMVCNGSAQVKEQKLNKLPFYSKRFLGDYRKNV